MPRGDSHQREALKARPRPLRARAASPVVKQFRTRPGLRYKANVVDKASQKGIAVYRRILLAYDGSLEGRNALREGALLAKRYEAAVFLLSVVAETPGMRLGDGAFAGAMASNEETYKTVFEEGVMRLKQLGFKPKARLVRGEPTQEIAAYAREISADLVVVGHRRQSLLSRWWSGSTGAYLADNVTCSVLISRNVVSDEHFKAELVKGPDASEP
jgi:nucleotide-binding universal stress UspA family protein